MSSSRSYIPRPYNSQKKRKKEKNLRRLSNNASRRSIKESTMVPLVGLGVIGEAVGRFAGSMDGWPVGEIVGNTDG